MAAVHPEHHQRRHDQHGERQDGRQADGDEEERCDAGGPLPAASELGWPRVCASTLQRPAQVRAEPGDECRQVDVCERTVIRRVVEQASGESRQQSDSVGQSATDTEATKGGHAPGHRQHAGRQRTQLVDSILGPTAHLTVIGQREREHQGQAEQGQASRVLVAACRRAGGRHRHGGDLDKFRTHPTEVEVRIHDGARPGVIAQAVRSDRGRVVVWRMERHRERCNAKRNGRPLTAGEIGCHPAKRRGQPFAHSSQAYANELRLGVSRFSLRRTPFSSPRPPT